LNYGGTRCCLVGARHAETGL